MTPFEEQLKQAMTRREPSAHFTARVLARVAEEERNRKANGRWSWLHVIQLRPLIAVMAAFLVIGGTAIYEQHRRAVQGEAAKERLVVAMRIAGSKLHEAQDRVFNIESMEVTQ